MTYMAVGRPSKQTAKIDQQQRSRIIVTSYSHRLD
jgi:hypothetical protein